MPAFSSETWFILFAVTGVTVTCCAYTLAALLRDHERIERLKADVATLRAEYDRRVREMNEIAEAHKAGGRIDESELGEVEIVESHQPHQQHSKAA